MAHAVVLYDANVLHPAPIRDLGGPVCRSLVPRPARVIFHDRASTPEESMLREYIGAAMHRARYEILSDDGTFYGEIPGFEGVYANAATLEACREELEEVLEEWVLFRVSRNLPLPEVDGITLQIRKVG